MKTKSDDAVLKSISASGPARAAEEFPAFMPVLSECVHFLHNLPATRPVPAGTLLIEQGCVAGTVHLIQTGLVKLVHLSASGRESTIGLRSEGWYAGYTSAFLNAPSAYSVRAVTDCKTARIPATEFSRRLMHDREMLGHFLAVLCTEAASQASLQVEVMSSSAEDRLDHFMRERTTHYPSHKTLDPLPALKQMELAQLLAVTPEHLSRMVKKKRNASRQAFLAEHPTYAQRRAESFPRRDMHPPINRGKDSPLPCA